MRARTPPQCQPPPKPPDSLTIMQATTLPTKLRPLPKPPDHFTTMQTTSSLHRPSLLDCGADGHLVTSTRTLRPDSIRSSSMVTQAFSGATARITHVGDHRSGLFPNCHVCPTSDYNLVAVGPYLDTNPNHAVILTPTLALQLSNLNFDIIAKSQNPRACLISHLQATDAQGNHRVKITTIGTRKGPGTLYHTNLFDLPNQHTLRKRLVNSARMNSAWSKGILSRVMKPMHILNDITSPTKRVTTTPATPSPDVRNALPKPDSAAVHAHLGPDLTWTTSTTTEQALVKLRELHCALGHPSPEVLTQALRGSPSKSHQQLIKYVKLMDKCNSCPAGNLRALPHPKSATTRSSSFLQRLVLDCYGRQPVATTGGAWYCLIIVDDATRWKWTRLLKSISQVATVFDDFLRTVVRQGMPNASGTVSFVRSDNGPDFNCDQFRQILRLHSITLEPSPPDASQQRGLAERGIGVTDSIARSNLFWSKAPLHFWGEAINHACTTSNNLPNSSNPGNKSPYQMRNPSKLSQVSLLRPFGCLAFTLVKVKDRSGKLNPASSCGFLAGYGVTPDRNINGYHVMNFRTL